MITANGVHATCGPSTYIVRLEREIIRLRAMTRNYMVSSGATEAEIAAILDGGEMKGPPAKS